MGRLTIAIALLLLSQGSVFRVAVAEPPLPRVDEDFMGTILNAADGKDRETLQTHYLRFIRDYEDDVLKRVGLPGPDVDPEPRNRRLLRNFKKLPVSQRIAVVAGARKELPDLVKKYVALDAQNKLDDPNAIDAALDSLQFTSQIPVPTKESAPVYYGDMIQRLGMVGGVDGGRLRRVYVPVPER